MKFPSVIVTLILTIITFSFSVHALTNINSCANLTSAGEIYNLTMNIINSNNTICMNVSADNVILNCNGRTIDGIDKDFSTGIALTRGVKNFTLNNCIITDWYTGAYIYNSVNSLIKSSTFSSNKAKALWIRDSSFINITSNNF
ncbi:MAG: hypothetical protein QW063_02030, partial [Candidatus Nanoarchaeia archaeon]